MPRFKSNANLFKYLDEEWDHNWLDKPSIFVPATKKWTYDREMTIDDVDIWEIIYEESGGKGVYASHIPLAEFYLICIGWREDGRTPEWETYYGPGAELQVRKRMEELKYPYGLYEVWIEEEDMWLYRQQGNL
jgi:hypothetical protein